MRLERIAGNLGKWGYFAGFIVMISMSAFLTFKIMFSFDSMLSNPTLLKLLEILTTAITIIIVAVPEGLPLAISISMAFSVDTMKNKGGLLIKNLEACETMGVVSEICVGKTATLTKNDMTVNSFYVAGRMV